MSIFPNAAIPLRDFARGTRGPIDETIERWEEVIGLCEKSSVRGENHSGKTKNTSVLALSPRGLCEKDVGLGEKETGLSLSSDVCATFDDGLAQKAWRLWRAHHGSSAEHAGSLAFYL